MVSETVRADELGMGDRYRASPTGPERTIRWAHRSRSGLAYFSHSDGSFSRKYNSSAELTRTFSAPRCECGKRYEFCQNDCFWPSEIERAYFGH